MKNFIHTFLIMTLILSGSVIAETSDKDKVNQKKQVLQLLKKLNRTERALAKKFNRLSPEAQLAVIDQTSDYNNSDEDSINDYLEDTLDLNKCSSDSDDDGLDDSQELEDGNNPSDDDSDDDGYLDGEDVHAIGRIENIIEEFIHISAAVCDFDQNTEFLDQENNLISKSDLKMLDCVELEGHIIELQIDGNLRLLCIADKVKLSDDC